tara:strand:+ start:2006 stop:2332 length:327 start_codon:yes stop_codon:yes gene_type:complete
MSFVLDRVTPLLEEKTSQAAILSSVLFFVVANPWIFKQVDGLMKKVGLNLHDQALTAAHSVVFGVLLYVLIIYLFNPVMELLDHHESQAVVAAIEAEKDEEASDSDEE